ncbi:MAG: hypothetical protein AMXMBFR7_52050 [Planctomycetota bacterium]
MLKHLPILILSIFMAALGVLGGWLAASKSAPAGYGAEAGHDEAGHEEHEQGPPSMTFSPQSLKNLGIVVQEAELTSFAVTIAIPAVVEEPATAEIPIFAPVSGRISEIRWAESGAIAARGAPLLTVLRDSVPRLELRLTDEILKPVNEEFHRSVTELRKSARAIELAKIELERVLKYTETGTEGGLPILPRKNLIDLQYELARTEKELANARAELYRHGCSDAQIADLEAGEPPPPLSQRIWKQVLEQNGLWTEMAQALHAALPEAVRNERWSVATIGELGAAGLATIDLLEWIKSDPTAGLEFEAIGGLLQEGKSVAEIRELHALHALGATVVVRAPLRPESVDWDIREVLVKPGESVTAGAKLLVLANPRNMYLRAEAWGQEAPVLQDALSRDLEISAWPLVEGEGPRLKTLKLTHIGSDGPDHGTAGIAATANEPLKVRDEGARGTFRTWKLRQGQRYRLNIPTKQFESVYVFPADAVTEDGPDRIVFLQNGDTFKPVKVEVLHSDHEVVVVANNELTEIFPGDPVVYRGAFALGLALKVGSGAAVDPHAGHSH